MRSSLDCAGPTAQPPYTIQILQATCRAGPETETQVFPCDMLGMRAKFSMDIGGYDNMILNLLSELGGRISKIEPALSAWFSANARLARACQSNVHT